MNKVKPFGTVQIIKSIVKGPIKSQFYSLLLHNKNLMTIHFVLIVCLIHVEKQEVCREYIHNIMR